MGKVSTPVRSAAMSHIEPQLPTILGRTKMRMKLLKIAVILLLTGSGEARPQKTEESPQVQPANFDWKPVQPIVPRNAREDSRGHTNETQRQLKDLQYIDQSLRTVATQLLNTTSPEDSAKIVDNNITKKSSVHQKAAEKNDASLVKEANTVQAMTIGYGRPMNSKFGFFESSHPGQAMAITEEELEREMSSTRLMTAYKNQPTTTGGISTWILLNPPPTTTKPADTEKKTKQPLETEVHTTAKPTTLMERVETTDRVMEKVTMSAPTSVTTEAPSTKKMITVSTKMTVSSKPEKNIDKFVSVYNSTLKDAQPTSISLESKEAVTSTKKIQTVRTTPKPKTATSKTTLVSKPSHSKLPRPNQHIRPKPLIRRTIVKPEIVRNENTTAKIEKVTFKPVQMITKNKSEIVEKPMFVTKIKASILMDNQKSTTLPTISSSSSFDFTTTTKPSSPISGLVQVPVKSKPVGTKVNNVLKVQLKKPVDDTTKIEIEPIKVNTPVLKIEKVEKEVTKEEEEYKENLNNSKVDLQFNFNPELTKVKVQAESPSSTTTTQASTTKRIRTSTKRKKNKVRRRKPSTSTTTTTLAPVTIASTTVSEEVVAENAIQESKIEPETKVANVNSTKLKKKPVQKPISTQIYNFLSREVMPSFGVMSLVGLGLGLASYFLYPFGGTIARRNYEVEPKYKYNFDEYGGNYGQSEEEVLSKVLQGMTTDDNKYPGIKDYDNNYYRYHHYEGNYESQTKKNDQRNPSSAPIYRPENTGSVLKYPNTDYRYPNTDTPSTPNYYERPKHIEYVVGQSLPGSANRQFVVGNIPKEYPPYDEKNPPPSTSDKFNNNYQPTESVKFDQDIKQNFNFPAASVQNYGQIQTARPEDGYEEVEITPTAVAVEHGPRSLKAKRSLPDSVESSKVYLRRKRDSVIQVIPSKRELEEEEKEEDLSNEILNIIDSALPGEDEDEIKRIKENEVEDYDSQRRKQKEEEKKRLKESVTTVTSTSSEMTTEESVSSSTKEAIDASSSTLDSETISETVSEATTTPSSKTTEESTVEWIDLTTKKPDEQNGFNLFTFVKKIAEIKFRLGLTLLKHASEGFARYLGHVQKRINGEE